MNKEIIEERRTHYHDIYEQWCLENPGYIMNTNGIREMACERILEECQTIEDIKILEKNSLASYSATKGPNGHLIIAETCKEIINLLEEDERTIITDK